MEAKSAKREKANQTQDAETLDDVQQTVQDIEARTARIREQIDRSRQVINLINAVLERRTP